MSPRHPFILALFPNARGIGYVALSNPKTLVDFGIATVRPLCNKQLIQRVTQLIDYTKPTVITVQDPAGLHTRTGKRTQRLIRRIHALAKERNLNVHQYSREEIREVFEQFSARTKYEISQVLAKWHPQLKPHAPDERKLWAREDYWQGMFDALSLALTHYFLSD